MPLALSSVCDSIESGRTTSTSSRSTSAARSLPTSSWGTATSTLRASDSGSGSRRTQVRPVCWAWRSSTSVRCIHSVPAIRSVSQGSPSKSARRMVSSCDPDTTFSRSRVAASFSRTQGVPDGRSERPRSVVRPMACTAPTRAPPSSRSAIISSANRSGRLMRLVTSDRRTAMGPVASSAWTSTGARARSSWTRHSPSAPSPGSWRRPANKKLSPSSHRQNAAASMIWSRWNSNAPTDSRRSAVDPTIDRMAGPSPWAATRSSTA